MVDKIIWPAYLDDNKSRKRGRRVPNPQAIDEPDVDEIARAVQQVGYDAVIERDVSYPRQHWEQSGRVRVKNAEDATKNDLLLAVAAYVTALRE